MGNAAGKHKQTSRQAREHGQQASGVTFQGSSRRETQFEPQWKSSRQPNTLACAFLAHFLSTTIIIILFCNSYNFTMEIITQPNTLNCSSCTFHNNYHHHHTISVYYKSNNMEVKSITQGGGDNRSKIVFLLQNYDVLR